MTLKLWDMELTKKYKHSIKNLNHKYYNIKFFEFFSKYIIIRSLSNGDKNFVVGSQEIQEI